MARLDQSISVGVFDAIDAGIVILDRDAHIVAWNDWFTRASGIALADAAGKSLGEVFAHMNSPRLRAAVSAAFDSGASSVLTHSLHKMLFPLKTRTGQTLIHDISVRSLGAAPYEHCLIQIVDVTVSVQREKVLRDRQNARYDAIVFSAPDVILTLDAEGLIQLANPAAESEFGYPLSMLIGKSIAQVIPKQRAWDELWKRALKGEQQHGVIEVIAQRRDGSSSYMEVSSSRWSSGTSVFVTAILREINERRTAEEQLRTLNQTLEQRVAERTADRDRMWRLSTDIMLVAQLNGIINAINPAWTRLLGWTEQALIGANLFEFIENASIEAFRNALAEMSSTKAPCLIEVGIATLNGDMRQIEWSAIVVDGLLHAVGRDVTNERMAERALRETEQALRQSQKMEAIGQLTGGIAHDFNNMLTGIIGPLDLLKRRIAAKRYDETTRFIDAAIASANRAAGLTHRLLAFSRRQPLDRKGLNLNSLIRNMEDMLRRTLGEQVLLTLDLSLDLWATLSDENQLENTILNLVINARDAMPWGGRLTIGSANVTVDQPLRATEDMIEVGEYVVLSVADTGTGMSQETLAKVFEPFFTTKPIGQGTGLGLSMIYGFVKQSHGHVRIESEEEKGTKILLYFPRYNGPVAAESSDELREAPPGAGETVLVVEDDSSVRLLIAELLRELGYACLEAGDGQAAIAILNSDVRIDLMVSDVGLPGMNGRQVADLARQGRPDLKILFVTGYAEHATNRLSFLAPGMEMITKPFNVDVLARQIREMISRS